VSEKSGRDSSTALLPAAGRRNDRDALCGMFLVAADYARRAVFLAAAEFAQGGQEAVYFFGGVVVHQADAQEAAGGLHAEAFS
jgi:hypothetical protein